jgi:PAS domain S-box-containing protein
MADKASLINHGLAQYAEAVVNTLQEPLLIIDNSAKVLFANPAFYVKFLVSADDTIGRDLYALGSGQWDIPDFRKNLREIVSHKATFNTYEVKLVLPDLGPRTVLLNARHIPDVKSEAILILIEDVTDGREAEHKLLLSEVRYRKLFETAKDGIILIDPATEKIIDANPFLLALIRYSKEEILGKELWEIGAVQDISYAKKMFEELQATGYVRYEDIPIKSKDGQEHEVEFVSNRYPIDGTEMIQCNIRDITERKAAEKKAATYLEGLEKLNKMMTGRELTMIELKKEIQILKEKLNPAEG